MSVSCRASPWRMGPDRQMRLVPRAVPVVRRGAGVRRAASRAERNVTVAETPRVRRAPRTLLCGF